MGGWQCHWRLVARVTVAFGVAWRWLGFPIITMRWGSAGGGLRPAKCGPGHGFLGSPRVGGWQCHRRLAARVTVAFGVAWRWLG
ncbi:MAG: hypothetical protein ACRDRL_27270, partial [Sciscionella sp.]